MKKILLSFLAALCYLTAFADESIDGMLFTLSDSTVVAVDINATDSITFSEDLTDFVFHHDDTIAKLAVNDVLDITYSTMPEGIDVIYNGAKAKVINPYYIYGVTTSTEGAYVTINNTDTINERTVTLTGSTTDGGLTYNGIYKSTFVLNGVDITSTQGAAIDIECGKRIAVELAKGTTNSLTDCSNGKQKAALYCKGHLEFDKSGTLNVTGNSKHAISAKEYIQFKKSTGIINILAAKNDGIHCGQYFVGNGYTFNISNIGGDGIQAEAETLAADEVWEEDYLNGSMLIQGGTYNISVTADDCDALKADTTITINSNKTAAVLALNTTGAACKGIKSNGAVNIGDSEITITQSGEKVVESGDASYSTAIKADLDINITAGTITINNISDGGKGLSADGNINISGDATTLNITANGTGGTYETEGSETSTEDETAVSYKMYFAKPASTNQGGFGGQSSQAWNSMYLYKGSLGSGSLVATLTTTETVNGTAYYTYDLSSDPTATYYLQSDDYTSRGGNGTYKIVTNTFTLSANGGYYLTISDSYSTTTLSGYRVYSYSTSSTASTSDTDTEETGETYNASCAKADNKITIDGGTITLINSGDMSKSLKADSIVINNGTVNSTVSGSLYVNGSDASYCSSMKCNYYIGNGGNVTLTASKGYACRGISADDDLTINGGTYTINNSCDGYVSSVDHYTAKALKCDKAVNIIGGDIYVTMSGTGGKGIKSGTTFVMGNSTNYTGPTLNVTTTGSALATGNSSSGNNFGGMQQSSGADSKAIKAQGAAYIYGGNLLVSTATDGAEGLESKTSITIYGGNHYLKCYDDCINTAGILEFAGGNTVCYSNGNDAVDSNYGKSGAVTISGGSIFAYTTKGSPEEGIDCDNNSYIKITGGIAVSAGAAQGNSSNNSVGSSTQGYYLGSSPSSYSSTYYYTLCNTSGTPICTYKFDANCSNSLSLLTASNLGTGSFTIKQGTSKPTACDSSVSNLSGNEVFFVNPTVTTTGTTATLTAK